MKKEEIDLRDRYQKDRDKTIDTIWASYKKYISPQSARHSIDMAKLAFDEGHKSRVQQTTSDIMIVGCSLAALSGLMLGTKNKLEAEGRNKVFVAIEKSTKHMLVLEKERRKKLSKSEYKIYKMGLMDVFKSQLKELNKV